MNGMCKMLNTGANSKFFARKTSRYQKIIWTAMFNEKIIEIFGTVDNLNLEIYFNC